MLPPPSSRLPPIRQISSHPINDLLDGLSYLRYIYNPEVQGSRRRRPEQLSSVDSNISFQLEADSDADGLDELRSDAFERSYVMRWLTSLVALTEDWNSAAGYDGASVNMRERLVQEAASLLAVCAGTAAAGVVVRDFVFKLGPERKETLKIHVKDISIDNNDFGSVGAQTWGGACVLTETILDDPSAFGLIDHRELRILELGAGTGLVSLALGKLIERAGPLSARQTVIATDYYPSVLENLVSNIQANSLDSSMIQPLFLDWSSFPNESDPNPPFDAPFDLILGADVVYEPQHAVWIKSCVTKLLRKPTPDHDSFFHLMIPLRATHSFESRSVDTMFPAFISDHIDSELQLVTLSKEIITCDTVGRGVNQVEYAYYKIGWR